MSELKIWKSAIIRGFVLSGITFFSSAVVVSPTLKTIISAGIAGGLYMFIELGRYYGVKTNSTKTNYNLLIFP